MAKHLIWLVVFLGVVALLISGCDDGTHYLGDGQYVQNLPSRIVRIEYRCKVRIAENDYQKITASGTGCIVGPHSVLTARHVVEIHTIMLSSIFGTIEVPVKTIKAQAFIIVRENGIEVAYPVKKIIKHKGLDAAILQTDWNLPTLPPIRIGNSSLLKRGDRVFVLGIPFYNKPSFYREGAVSCIDHERLLIYTEMRIIPGYSGAPVFAIRYGKAELVGITTGIIVAYGFPDVSVVVPINRIFKGLKM